LTKPLAFIIDVRVILLTGESMEPAHTTKKAMLAAFRTREILAAARRLMAEQGVDALTMDEIAQAAGVAKGTLYLYFQSKDELIQALLSQVGEAIAQDLEAILAQSEPPPAKLRQMAMVLLQSVERESALFPVYLRELVRSKSGRRPPSSLLQELEDRIVALITRMFAEGMAQGQFLPADPRLMTFLLKGLVRAVGYYQMTRGQEDVVQEALPVVLTLLQAGIVRSPAPTPEESPL
jgi:AcrR family transcriptional regulator